MATRLKTVLWSFPVLASLTNNTLTNVPQTTLFLPENAKVFRSVKALVTMNDIITATGGTVTTKTVGLRLGAAAYTSIANANALTNSGENLTVYWEQDFTAHFSANWTGTSMTCDFQLQFNQSTGTTLGFVNVNVTLEITYEYDDTSATHIKTIYWALNAPVGALPTAATTHDTIPALDTELPEAAKVYRNIHLVVQGNTSFAAGTTNHTLTVNVGAATVTTQNYVGALSSDQFFRYVWDLTASYPSKAATQAFQLFASVASRCNHVQAWLVVTYEFDPAATTRVMNSVMLPMDMDSPMGGLGATEAQRATRQLRIPEPGSIVTENVAFFPFWSQLANITGFNMRIGTGAFVTYTDSATVTCGANAAMIRNDSAVALAKGNNTLIFDCYRTDGTDLGWNVSGFWIVNYSSDKAPEGVGAHNNTVFWGIAAMGTAAATGFYTTAATALTIPEPDYFINAVGTRNLLYLASGATPSGIALSIERLAAEGGVQWEAVYHDIPQNDPEVGAFYCFSQARELFLRWPGDTDADRVDIEVARRYRSNYPNATGLCAFWQSISVMLTYHSVTYDVADSIAGFTGTVSLSLHKAATGEQVKESTRSGDGAFAFTWYDDTELMFVTANDGTNVGRSQNTLPA